MLLPVTATAEHLARFVTETRGEMHDGTGKA
jgi:hypothetical protein